MVFIMNTGLKKSPHNPGLSFCVAQVCEMTFGTQYNGHVVLDIGGSGLVTLADLVRRCRGADRAGLGRSLDLAERPVLAVVRTSGFQLPDASLFSRNSALEICGA